jgi:hypothetical protein
MISGHRAAKRQAESGSIGSRSLEQAARNELGNQWGSNDDQVRRHGILDTTVSIGWPVTLILAARARKLSPSRSCVGPDRPRGRDRPKHPDAPAGGRPGRAIGTSDSGLQGGGCFPHADRRASATAGPGAGGLRLVSPRPALHQQAMIFLQSSRATFSVSFSRAGPRQEVRSHFSCLGLPVFELMVEDSSNR